MQFEDYLRDVGPANMGPVSDLHALLMENGFILKMELAKNGYVVSYQDPKVKRVAANFIMRKKGPVIRLYGDHVHKQEAVIASLSDTMKKSIAAAPDCKRLHDPTKCNSRCAMGYPVTIDGTLHKKCRYNCLMFEINPENYPHIKSLVAQEIAGRVG